MRKFISNFISIRTAEFLSEEHLRFAGKLSIYEENEESQNSNVMLLDTASKSNIVLISILHRKAKSEIRRSRLKSALLAVVGLIVFLWVQLNGLWQTPEDHQYN